jgi:hypothetical protein
MTTPSAAPVVPPPREVKQAYYEELSPGQRAALVSWLSFATTFATVRAITYSIRGGHGPLRNVTVGAIHIHHYLWGIATLVGVGAVAVRGEDRTRHHPTVAAAYGVGSALIVDEFALLLDLEDVYWTQQGRLSVDVAVGAIAVAGSYFAGLPVWRRLRRDRASS